MSGPGAGEDGFLCSRCGEWHEGLPMAYGPDAPARWFALPAGQRARRARLGSDQCIVDNTDFFIRGRVEIPVEGSDEEFAWEVWVRVSVDDFDRASDLWETPGRETEPPAEGTIDTYLPYEPATVGLPVLLHTRPVGERPWVEVRADDHPLAREQRAGIPLSRVREIAEMVLHPAT